MILHRWDYDPATCRHVCIPNPGTPGNQRCDGCGAMVTDLQLFTFFRGQNLSVGKSAALNLICDRAQKHANHCH